LLNNTVSSFISNTKMHFSTTIFLPLTLLLVTSTAAQTQSHLQRRGLPGAVYICTGPNFWGNCAWQGPSNSCRIIGTGAMAPESVGPDPGGFCQLYSNSGCSGNPVRSLRFPGAAGGLPHFQSIKCFIDGGFRYRPAGRVSTQPDTNGDENVRLKTKSPTLKSGTTEFDISEGVIGLKTQGTTKNPNDNVPVDSLARTSHH